MKELYIDIFGEEKIVFESGEIIETREALLERRYTIIENIIKLNNLELLRVALETAREIDVYALDDIIEIARRLANPEAEKLLCEYKEYKFPTKC